MAPEQLNFTIAGRPFRVSPRAVEAAMRGVAPHRVRRHFVVVNAMRYPPKQVVAEVTGVPVAEFTTHQAVRTLRRLGFVTSRSDDAASTERFDIAPRTRGTRTPGQRPRAARRTRGLSASAVAPEHRPAAPMTPPLEEALRAHAGQWVAVRGPDLLMASPRAGDVIAWLTANGEHADSMYKVPADVAETVGAAPA